VQLPTQGDFHSHSLTATNILVPEIQGQDVPGTGAHMNDSQASAIDALTNLPTTMPTQEITQPPDVGTQLQHAQQLVAPQAQKRGAIIGDRITVKYETGWFRGEVTNCTPGVGDQTLNVRYDHGVEAQLQYPNPGNCVFVEGLDTIPTEVAEQNMPPQIANTAGPQVVTSMPQVSAAGTQVVMQTDGQLVQPNLFPVLNNNNMQFMAPNMQGEEMKKRKASGESTDDSDTEKAPQVQQIMQGDAGQVYAMQQQQQQQAMQQHQMKKAKVELANPASKAPAPGVPSVVPPTVLNRLQAQEVNADERTITHFCCIAGITYAQLQLLLEKHTWIKIRKNYNPGGGVINRGEELMRILACQ